jgi:hypothetical protein
MFGIGVPELLILLLLMVPLGLFTLYWIIRLAVRHGRNDGPRIPAGDELSSQALIPHAPTPDRPVEGPTVRKWQRHHR